MFEEGAMYSFGAGPGAARPRGTVAGRNFDWSVEELRSLAVQLQLPDAARKTRHELLELLAGIEHRESFPKFGKSSA
jgi:hypothetical protein